MSAEPQYAIWSNEHRAWWAPGRWGYTHSLARAGRFTLAEATEICERANLGGRRTIEAEGRPFPYEVAVLAPSYHEVDRKYPRDFDINRGGV
jgi:hypothetical protein